MGGNTTGRRARGNVFDKGSARKVYRNPLRQRAGGGRAVRDAPEQDRDMDYFLCVIGMVLIVEGLPYFAFPARMKAWIALITAASERHLRRVGLALMAVGLWLVYLGRP